MSHNSYINYNRTSIIRDPFLNLNSFYNIPGARHVHHRNMPTTNKNTSGKYDPRDHDHHTCVLLHVHGRGGYT